MIAENIFEYSFGFWADFITYSNKHSISQAIIRYFQFDFKIIISWTAW